MICQILFSENIKKKKGLTFHVVVCLADDLHEMPRFISSDKNRECRLLQFAEHLPVKQLALSPLRFRNGLL